MNETVRPEVSKGEQGWARTEIKSPFVFFVCFVVEKFGRKHTNSTKGCYDDRTFNSRDLK